MKRLFAGLAVVAVAALIVSSALAQQPGRQRQGAGGGGGMSSVQLLGQKSVQEELKLTDDQVKKVTDLTQKQRELFRGVQDLSQEERAKKMQELQKENQKAVADILKPEQAKRLKQITLQLRGGRALTDPEVAKELGLTAEQKQKVKEIQDETAKETAKLRDAGLDRQEAAKKRQEITKSSNEKLTGILTADQKTKWKEMTGEPFKGEIRPLGGAGGRRPGGRQPPA
jgi:Spy/CpxP family protein refolding chaperone